MMFADMRPVPEHVLKLETEPRLMTIVEFTEFQKSESERWGNLIKTIGLKVD